METAIYRTMVKEYAYCIPLPFHRIVEGLSGFSWDCSGVRKRVVSKRVVLADVPPERKPERGYVRQNHPFGNRPFISPMTLFGIDKRVVSKRVVSADVPPERKPERGYVRQNHPFTKPPFYLPVNCLTILIICFRCTSRKGQKNRTNGHTMPLTQGPTLRRVVGTPQAQNCSSPKFECVQHGAFVEGGGVSH